MTPQKYIGTIVNIYSENHLEKRIISYSPIVKKIKDGDRIIIDNAEYVRVGSGHEWKEKDLYYILVLYPPELWEESAQRFLRQQKWEVFIGLRQKIISYERPVHRVYALEDLC